jgi:hypothetical protein
VTVCNTLIFYVDEQLALQPTPPPPQLKDHPLSAVCHCDSIYLQLPSISGSHFSICNLRARHATVTRGPPQIRNFFAINTSQNFCHNCGVTVFPSCLNSVLTDFIQVCPMKSELAKELRLLPPGTGLHGSSYPQPLSKFTSLLRYDL